MKYKISIIFIFSFVNYLAYGSTYIRPMPSELRIVAPADARTVYDANISYHIHESLFKQDKFSRIYSNLIKDFNVSKDMLTYTLILKDKKFHNGEQFNCSLIKSNLDHFVKNKIVGYKSLKNIAGFKTSKLNIKNGKAGNICEIKLSTPEPELIKKLTSFKLSILDKERNPQNGLGLFKVKKSTKNKIELEFIGKNSEIKNLNIVKANKKRAMELFKKNKAHDLFFYKLVDSDISDLKFKSTKMDFPKTYFSFLNYKTIKKKERRKIIESIDWNKLVSKCYELKNINHSYLPKNFLGHQKNLLKQIKHKVSKKYRLDIHQTDQNEKCVKKELEGYSFLKVRILPIEKSFNDWVNGKTDIMFTFLESDANSDIDFASAFVENNSLFLGAPNIKLNEHFTKIQKTTDLIKRDTLLKSFYSLVFKDYVALPLFHPSEKLYYNKLIKNIELGVNSYIMTTVNEFEFE